MLVSRLGRLTYEDIMLIKASFFLDFIDFMSIGIEYDQCWCHVYHWRKSEEGLIRGEGIDWDQQLEKENIVCL